MANEKFEPTENISDVEIRLECLRLATEFGPEYERKDPLNVAEKYFNWVKKFLATIERPLEKSLIADYNCKEEIRFAENQFD